MEIKKIIKKEIEEEVIDKMLCDNCNGEIKYPNSCGYGAKYKLSDAWCSGCGGKNWDFCSFKCLREFVNNNELDEPKELKQSSSKEEKGVGNNGTT